MKEPQAPHGFCAWAVLLGLLFLAGGAGGQTKADFASSFYAVAFDPSSPAFTFMSVDSLGRRQLSLSPVIPSALANGPFALERLNSSRFRYIFHGPGGNSAPSWEIELSERTMTLRSRYVSGAPSLPWTVAIDQQRNHATLLGLMSQDGSIKLPALLHLPDQGTFRISALPNRRHSLGYQAAQEKVQIAFPAATLERPLLEYHWQVVDIYPPVAGVAGDARFDGFRRNWLNIFQISPQWRMLANHASSDTCVFCYYEYADVARRTPALAKGLAALDMVRQTLDRIIHGANGYGMPGHGAFPEFSSDALPSLLIAAEDYVEGAKDLGWLKANYAQLRAWTEKMLATDHDGSGLIQYGLSGNSGSWPEQLRYRPANWWDTIGFGHQDAYANALAYRALGGMERMAQQAGQPADQRRYGRAADKLRAAYLPTFYNPATGVLAGWRSADGQLHDYYFLWVNGIAIHYGLVPTDKANSILDRLLAKMKEAGYARFDLGLPGNLIPVARKDYVDLNRRFGGGAKEDNSDGFQIYENGGATACFAYFTLAALYDLGRVAEADRILFPMLDAFAKGAFQGRAANGLSYDWKAWDGAPWGYEGFLVDNYYALLAVLDRQAALRRMPQRGK